jgi:hypothetical protein
MKRVNDMKLRKRRSRKSTADGTGVIEGLLAIQSLNQVLPSKERVVL